MQGLGFTLRELIRFVQLLEIEPHNPAERRACVEAKLERIDEQIERLCAMRSELRERLQICQCCNASTINPHREAAAKKNRERRRAKE
jgi:DNA-binding transcriptional MerR regulator